MRTLRIGRWSQESPLVCTSPFGAELSAMRLHGELAFGSCLFLNRGNAHLGVLLGLWSVDLEFWWPVRGLEAEA